MLAPVLVLDIVIKVFDTSEYRTSIFTGYQNTVLNFEIITVAHHSGLVALSVVGKGAAVLAQSRGAVFGHIRDLNACKEK